MKSFFQNLMREWQCFIPILGLFFLVSVNTRLNALHFAPAFSKIENLIDIPTKEALTSSLDVSKNTTTTEIQDRLIAQNGAYTARMRWLSFCCVYICVCVSALVAAFFIAFSILDKHRFRFRIIVSILAIVVACTYLSGSRGTYSVSEKLLKETVAIAKPSGFPDIMTFTISLDKFAFGVAFFLATVAGLCLYTYQQAEESKTSAYLARRLELLKSILYIATVVLISSILFWSFTLRWSLAYVGPSSGKIYQSIDSIIMTILSGRGLYYTTMLAMTYLPVAFILNYRTLSLALCENPEATTNEREDWRKKHSLAFSPLEFMPKMLAILGPFLTGPFTELLALLK